MMPDVFRNGRYEQRLAALQTSMLQLALAVQHLINEVESVQTVMKWQAETIPGEYARTVREHRPH